MEVKHYKDLSADDKKKYETAINRLRNLNSQFATYQRKDGSWTSDVKIVIWGAITPTERVSKKYWQTLRFDMRRHSADSIDKVIEKANTELYNLPKGYKWTEPIFFKW